MASTFTNLQINLEDCRMPYFVPFCPLSLRFLLCGQSSENSFTAPPSPPHREPATVAASPIAMATGTIDTDLNDSLNNSAVEAKRPRSSSMIDDVHPSVRVAIEVQTSATYLVKRKGNKTIVYSYVAMILLLAGFLRDLNWCNMVCSAGQRVCLVWINPWQEMPSLAIHVTPGIHVQNLFGGRDGLWKQK